MRFETWILKRIFVLQQRDVLGYCGMGGGGFYVQICQFRTDSPRNDCSSGSCCVVGGGFAGWCERVSVRTLSNLQEQKMFSLLMLSRALMHAIGIFLNYYSNVINSRAMSCCEHKDVLSLLPHDNREEKAFPPCVSNLQTI